MSSPSNIKFQLGIKIYLVPNLESSTVRVLEGNLTIERNIVAYVAYVEENGQMVPRVRFEN